MLLSMPLFGEFLTSDMFAGFTGFMRDGYRGAGNVAFWIVCFFGVVKLVPWAWNLIVDIWRGYRLRGRSKCKDVMATERQIAKMDRRDAP